MTPRRRRLRQPAPDPAPGDPVIELPGPTTAQLVARQFSYPQLRAFVAANPPGSANERAAFDAIHLLIGDPDLYRGSQVDAIAAAMSPLQIVADRRVLPPGPLADTLTAALTRHHERERDDLDHGHGHGHGMPDPPPPGVEATVTTLRPPAGGPAGPAGRAPTTPDLSPPDVEPEYLASLIAETEARIAAGETDLIGEPDPADDLDLDLDLEDYSSLATDHDQVTREQGNELDYACGAAALDRDDLERDDLERARVSLAEVRDGLDDWDRRRAAHEQPSRDTTPTHPSTSRLEPAALEADRARRDVAEQEAQRHAGTEQRTDLAAEHDAEPHVP